MLYINKENFEEVLNSEKKVVIDFWANWCGPCKIIAPIFEKVSEELSGMFIFAKLDIDEAGNSEICEKLNIKAIPTIKVFKKGEEIGMKVGVLTERQLKEFLSEV